MLNQRLDLKQQLKLTPQQLQLMKLLQLPALALEEQIQQEIEKNPALEEDAEKKEEEKKETDSAEEVSEEIKDNERDTEEFDMNDHYDEDDVANYKLKDNNYLDPDDYREKPISYQEGFHQQLLQQFAMLSITEKERGIGEVIIGNIDDAGYLQRSVEAMVNDLAFFANIDCSEDEVRRVLEKVQELDPPGVGASDLRECLLLQLKALLSETQGQRKENLLLAEKILLKYYDAFIHKHYKKIIERLHISEESLTMAMDEIKNLNPKPGGGVQEQNSNNPTIVPDYFLQNVDGELVLSLHERNNPPLRVSRIYRQMLQDYSQKTTAKLRERTQQHNKEAVQFIRQKIDSAQWFISLIEQRKQTLLHIMQVILDFQHEYFMHGNIALLKPMRLKDIAEITGLDISTISRVTGQKYIQTHFGTFLLKEFFSQSLTNIEGEEVSATGVRDVLQKLVEAENKREPLSDEALVAALREKGFELARRTVAKYRDMLNIPVARLRKEI